MGFDRDRCEAIVRRIESGELVEQHPGIVDLPASLASATYDGRVYVTHLPSGRLYLFKTQIGLRSFDFFGYLYSTVPIENLGIEREEDVGEEPANEILEAVAGFVPPSDDSPEQGAKLGIAVVRTKWPGWLRAFYTRD